MSQPISSPLTRNSLLSALSPDDYALLQPHLHLVSLRKGEQLIEPNEPIQAVYFPETALGSVVVASPEGMRMEAHMFGCEGTSGSDLIVGSDRTPLETIAQGEGEALRMTAMAFKAAMAQSPSLLATMLRYVQTVHIQTTYTALSNASHTVDERLARWLLMCHDRCPGDEMPLTHHFLSIMLGVRRPSVTTSLHMLEAMGLIRAYRGMVLVRDRTALQDYARDAYGIPEAEYARLIGPMPKAEELAEAARRRANSQKQIDSMNLDPSEE